MSTIEIGETQRFPSVLNVRRGSELRRYVPERTCHMPFDDREYRYRCSRCGCLSETYRHADGKYYAPDYCPHCGARVVEEDE